MGFKGECLAADFPPAAGAPTPQRTLATENQEHTNAPFEAAAREGGLPEQTMGLCVWFLLGPEAPGAGPTDESRRMSPGLLCWQMRSQLSWGSLGSGQPGKLTAPNCSCSRGLGLRQGGVEAEAGAGGRGGVMLAPGRARKKGPAHGAQGKPHCALGAPRGWRPPAPPTFLSSGGPSQVYEEHPRRGHLGPAGSRGPGWPSTLARPVRLGREQRSDFPLGWIRQRFQKK